MPPNTHRTRRYIDFSRLAHSCWSKTISQNLINPSLNYNQTPISMSSLMMHHNENVFPQSHTFSPERWADQEDGGKALERYLVSFSKGSRQCIGMGSVTSSFLASHFSWSFANTLSAGLDSQRQKYISLSQRSFPDIRTCNCTIPIMREMLRWLATCSSHKRARTVKA